MSADRKTGHVSEEARRAQELYGDIIDMPHHVSSTRPQMPREDRAAQFSPFAALTGFEDAVGETARLTEDEAELGEDSIAELNSRMAELIADLPGTREAEITFFMPDPVKKGGRYVTVTGTARKFSSADGILTMSDGLEIDAASIARIRWADGSDE
jgi:hypothetical protein